MDRQLRVTDDICEQHMRDLKLNLLLNLSRHIETRLESPYGIIVFLRLVRRD
jgi:hypothetical protein